MRKGLLLVALCCCLLACSKAPDAHDSSGNPIRLSQYHGKWVLVNYWATWCQPCVTEIPLLNQFYQQHRQQVVVLGVSFDQLSNAELKKVIQRFAVRYPMLSTFPLQKFGIQTVAVLPMTLVINPQGQLATILKGPLNKAELTAATRISTQP